MKINLLKSGLISSAVFSLFALSACNDAMANKNTVSRAKTAAVSVKTDTALKPITALFYLQDGVEVLDFAGPLEVFDNAGITVSFVSKTKAPIKSQGVLKITPDYSIADAPHADIIAFFGGSTKATTNDPEVINWIKSAIRPDYYFSVCTGAFILGKAGILDGMTATTFASAIPQLKTVVPKAKVLSNVRFVDNGRVITTAGISAGIDGALHMVSKLLGEAKAIEVAKIMEYDKWVPNQGLVIQKIKS